MSYDFHSIANKFEIDGSLVYCERYGDGHINETYLIAAEHNGVQTRYILQRINNDLFADVPRLMNNIDLVTKFAYDKIAERGGDTTRETMSVIYAKDGHPFYYDGKNYFRMYTFIEDATSYSIVKCPEDFYQSAVAFANFANLLAEFDATQLYEPLPNFHNTVKRYENFLKAVEENRSGRLDQVEEEIAFATARKDICSWIVEKLQSGEIPTKVTHNDTKLNNVMLDNATGHALAVIDLDTIMPGSICYDFGDSIRFGCNPVAEDEKDLSKVNFSLELFEQYTKGYVSTLRETMTQSEADMLARSAILMTYECGIRFLSDFLDGDVYFRTHRPEHNLDRCRTQFKLVSDMEKLLPEMEAIVAKYYNA